MYCVKRVVTNLVETSLGVLIKNIFAFNGNVHDFSRHYLSLQLCTGVQNEYGKEVGMY